MLAVVFVSLCGMAQQKAQKFDPAQFQAKLEQYITTKAGLTPQEAAVFFPLYREMRDKQWAYFSQERRWRHVDTSDDKACAAAIRKRDDSDIEVKRLQQSYHEKFMRVLPASKVFLVLKAEEQFHRKLIKRPGMPEGQKQRK